MRSLANPCRAQAETKTHIHIHVSMLECTTATGISGWCVGRRTLELGVATKHCAHQKHHRPLYSEVRKSCHKVFENINILKFQLIDIEHFNAPCLVCNWSNYKMKHLCYFVFKKYHVFN